MDGWLDETNEAFLTLDFGQGPLDFLLDTGFLGTLVVGEELFDTGGATPDAYAEADLAADQTFVFPCFFVEFDWFGARVRVRILVGPGTECLFGTELLNPHRLEIDYGKRTVELSRNPSW